jgi:hypothetical protein
MICHRCAASRSADIELSDRRDARAGMVNKEALAAEALVKGISNGGIGEAEADVELLHLMPAAATANRNAALTVEGIKLEVLAAEAAARQLELDEVRELPLIHVPSAFALAAAHARRSSDRRRGGFLMHHSLRQARPWQKPLKYHTWSRPTAHWGESPC